MQVAHFSKFLILKTKREKSFFTNHNNNLQIILKYIEPCFNCECPTCDINIKKDAIVCRDDKLKYDTFISSLNNSHCFDFCHCPNCYIYKCGNIDYICNNNEKNIFKKFEQKYIKMFKKYIKNQLELEGIYFYTLFDFGESNWNPRCLHFFLINDGTFRVYKDLEFERYNYLKWESRIETREKYKNVYRKNRYIRQYINVWKYWTYFSIDELMQLIRMSYKYNETWDEIFYKQFAKTCKH